MLGLAGVIDMETKVAEVTVSVVLPEILPKMAVRVAVPAVTPVARPFSLIVATNVADEVQVTSEVISLGVASELNVPVATNCCVACRGKIGLAGVTLMDPGLLLPHANKHTAKEIKNNIAETSLRTFMSTPLDKSKSPPRFLNKWGLFRSANNICHSFPPIQRLKVDE